MRDEAWTELKRLTEIADTLDSSAVDILTGMDANDLAVPLPMMALVMLRGLGLAGLTIAARLESLTFVLSEGFDALEEQAIMTRAAAEDE